MTSQLVGGAPSYILLLCATAFCFFYAACKHGLYTVYRNEKIRNSWQQQKQSLFNILQMFCSAFCLAQFSVELKTHFNCWKPGGWQKNVIIFYKCYSLLFTWPCSDQRAFCFLSGLFCRVDLSEHVWILQIKPAHQNFGLMQQRITPYELSVVFV